MCPGGKDKIFCVLDYLVVSLDETCILTSGMFLSIEANKMQVVVIVFLQVKLILVKVHFIHLD